jgi:hypothetical protein
VIEVVVGFGAIVRQIYIYIYIYISTIAIVGADIVAIGSRFLGFNKF